MEQNNGVKTAIRRSQVGMDALNTELYSQVALPALKWLKARYYSRHFWIFAVLHCWPESSASSHLERRTLCQIDLDSISKSTIYVLIFTLSKYLHTAVLLKKGFLLLIRGGGRGSGNLERNEQVYWKQVREKTSVTVPYVLSLSCNFHCFTATQPSGFH